MEMIATTPYVWLVWSIIDATILHTNHARFPQINTLQQRNHHQETLHERLQPNPHSAKLPHVKTQMR